MAGTIDQFKKQYADALARNDAAGMKAANDGANAIRAQTGQKFEDASGHYNKIAAQSNVALLSGTPEPGSQESHQAWINNPNSGFGGMDQYTNMQQNKWNQAVLTGDTEMMGKLQADMNRVGYSINQYGQVSQGNTQGGGGSGTVFQAPPVPTMRSGASMADLLGITHDQSYIDKRFQDAVDKKYANMDVEFGRTQDMYYDMAANNADMLMGSMRRGDRDAVTSGTAQGTQAAQEMSALLGVSADSAQGATELAQGRSDLVSERESEKASVAKDALKYYNELGINLGQLSSSELNALTQAYAAQIATAGGVYNTDVLAGVERDRIASTEKIAAGDRVSRENIATWQNASNEEIAKQTGLSQKEVEEIRAKYNKEVAEINGKYAPKYNSGSGSSGGGTMKTVGLSELDRLSGLYGMIENNPDNKALVDTINAEIAKMLGIELKQPHDPALRIATELKILRDEVEQAPGKQLTPKQLEDFRAGVRKRGGR